MGLELAGFDPFQASRVLEFRVSPFVKVVEHQLMLQTASGPPIGRIRHFAGIWSTRIPSISFCEGRRASNHAPNGI